MEKIKLIYGPMKAGKSQYLIDLYEKKTRLGKTVEVFEPEENTRDGAFLKSRAYNKKIPASVYRTRLRSNADVVILDELNLVNVNKIEQLKKDLIKLKNQGKQIYIASLDTMADKREFPQYTLMKDFVDRKKQITGKCEICGKPSTHQKLIRDPRATDYIEGQYNKYVACCEEHWENIKIKNLF